MSKGYISSIKILNACILDHNPFEGVTSVTDSEIWQDRCPDVLPLNQDATQAILQALQQVSRGQKQVFLIAIAAQNGSGKSHLMGRIRRHLQTQGGAFFIYVNASQYQDVNLIRYQFRQNFVDSLRRPGSQNTMQWQELAAQIANQALKTINPEANSFAPQQLIKKLAGNTQAKNLHWVNQLTEAWFKMKPDIGDPDLVRAIVWTLSNAQAPFALKWLSGKAIAQWKLEELGLPHHPPGEREAEAFETVMQILQLMSDYQPSIICFDQLEDNDPPEKSVKRERVVASLVKRLHDSFSLVKVPHGVVLLTAMTPETWKNKVQNLPGNLAKYISGNLEPMSLNSIDGDAILALVANRLKNFYGDLTPPTPVYPFDENQLKALGREKLTTRQALEWCAENFRPVEVDPLEKVEAVFQDALAADQSNYLEDNTLIAGALSFALQTLMGQTIEGIEIEAINMSVKPKGENQGYINFCVTGRENGQSVNIGVAVLQEDSPKALAAGLKRLTQYKTFGFSRGCLVRAKEKVIPCHWQAYQYLEQLIEDLGGNWVQLTTEEIWPLFAIWSIYIHRADYGLSDGQILDFIVQKRIIADNLLIRGILSFSVGAVGESAIALDATQVNTAIAPIVEKCTSLLPLPGATDAQTTR